MRKQARMHVVSGERSAESAQTADALASQMAEVLGARVKQIFGSVELPEPGIAEAVFAERASAVVCANILRVRLSAAQVDLEGDDAGERWLVRLDMRSASRDATAYGLGMFVGVCSILEGA